jgi:addiction module RelE/StbE family toxin
MEYHLRYLPMAKKDITEIVTYIAEELEAPKAALNLLDELEEKINKLTSNPYAHRLYRPSMPIDTEYRLLPVKNYLIFYVVFDDIIEVHRVIYKKRDLAKIIRSTC